MEHFNLILDTDSYKASHFLQYPPQTTKLTAYLESRGGKYDKTVFFGLQYILKKYLTQKITEKDVKGAGKFFLVHGLPFNTDGWMYIAKELQGKIPLRIFAVPEGTVVPTGNILMRVESTDPRCFWVTSWFETMLLRVWYPITVATHSYFLKQLIYQYLQKTADDPDAEVIFKLHDFGARGVSSAETASIGGAAHLVNFQGSDTVLGIVCANEYYHSDMAAFSIPAAEHSTIITWGKDREVDAYENMLNHFAKPNKLVAVVSDSYDFYQAVDTIWGKQLKEKVEKSQATIVIRSDSGHPATVVLHAIQSLEKNYGVTINKKGYKVLNHVRIIQGDGVNEHTIQEILEALTRHHYSGTNIAFGMGGALLQQVNRDTQKFAYKISEVEIAGKAIPVAKNPVTDPGKKSKSGCLDLIKENGEFKTIIKGKKDLPSELKEVYKNGTVVLNYDLLTIRNNVSMI